ncbi:MAG: DnaB-like helicase C-terminal domain-containing protein, partial [Gemmatimonadales bacterium]
LRIRDLPLTFRPLYGQDFSEITDQLRMVPPRALIIVDSLQMVEPPRSGPTSEETLALAIRALKGLALDRNVTVLALVQLTGAIARREDPRPTLDDLGGLGAVKQHCDVVLGVYREEMYRPGQGMEGATELIVAKNRNGPTGFVDLYFYQRWLRFEDMLDPEEG